MGKKLYFGSDDDPDEKNPYDIPEPQVIPFEPEPEKEPFVPVTPGDLERIIKENKEKKEDKPLLPN